MKVTINMQLGCEKNEKKKPNSNVNKVCDMIHNNRFFLWFLLNHARPRDVRDNGLLDYGCDPY